MSISDPFIRRPVGTTLLTLALALAGALGYMFLPVAPLPQVEFPTISVSASLPGASPEIMASAVATPLERQFGRIAGVTEMTSSSTLGSSSVTLQFDLNRDIDAAARDVQAAINAAAGQLPSNLPSLPSYRKVNPADAPIFLFALTSDVYDKARMYDAAATVLQQKLSQVPGVGQVTVGGGALPAVRVEVNPSMLYSMGLGMDDVRSFLGAANVNRPKGKVADERRSWTILATDQLLHAKDYEDLVVAYRNGAPVQLSSIARVVDGLEDTHTGGLSARAGEGAGKPAVILVIFRQPGANIIDTVDRIRATIPWLKASLPAGIDLDVVMDRTTTIRASVDDVEIALGLSVGLVVLVVFLFLRSARATFIPGIAVPISLIATFGVMYLVGYSIDNLSLMALTIATGFVVDDAIVVVENISRHLEAGDKPFQAAVKGAREIGFTVVSISISLIAVFIPILLMGGLVGRLFREFAVTLSVAIAISMVVSLTTTPMMCAVILKHKDERREGWLGRASERAFNRVLSWYEWLLDHVLAHPAITVGVLLFTVGLTVALAVVVPKGFFPQQDTGRLTGNIQADQDTSSRAMQAMLGRFASVMSMDPAVDNVVAFTGGGGGGNTVNTGRMFVALKPLSERKLSADEVIGRIRGKLSGKNAIPGATLYLQSVQDVRIGGRASSAQYQYSLQGQDFAELTSWAPKMLGALRDIPGVVDSNSDQQNRGLQADVTIDRAAASRLLITPQQIDDALYDAFGQRQVSTMYTNLNQYHVVMESDPELIELSQGPSALRHVYVRPAATSAPASATRAGVAGAIAAPIGPPVPLGSFAKPRVDSAPLSVTHEAQFPSVTLSFNLTPGTSLGDVVDRIKQAEGRIGLPASIHGRFSGAAQAFQESLTSEPLLIAAALLAVYIVLGMLYESLIHPITILSTLPSAGVGALLALLITRTDLSVMSLIGIILLIGIVKKNAIMMIDFALDAERTRGLSSHDAIREACLLRFRPITMTTMAALFGSLPLAIGFGVGSELRRPMGIAVVGGLIFSQALTLFTTPVVYLLLDRLRHWASGHSKGSVARPSVGTALILLAVGIFVLTSASCTVGPNYKSPDVQAPATFKSAAEAESAESHLTADWWTLFDDSQLDALECKAVEHNTDVRAAAARVAQARAATRSVESQFYPVVTLDPSVQRQRTPNLRANGSSNSGASTYTSVTVPFDLSYEVDAWGRVRRSVEASSAQMRSSAADFGVVLQTLTADVAQDYFMLRSLDAQDAILTESVDLYRRQVSLLTTEKKAGIVGQSDVLQAQALYSSTEALAIDIRRQRRDVEHALAILLGQPPSEIAVDAQSLKGAPPQIPAGLPSDLLRRRPDIVEAEENLRSATALVGVATANFYPVIRLTGAAGFESLDLQHALDWENRFWSFGPSVSFPLFEGGKLRADLAQAKARYDELEATYRGVVLGAFRDVEDSLTDLHMRADAAVSLDSATTSAAEVRRLAELEYRQGLVGYLQVLDAERTLLTNQLAAEQVRGQRFISTVLLAKALGGGWSLEQGEEDPRTKQIQGPP
jgi:multidrug efflux pump